MCSAKGHVRSTPKSGHVQRTSRCPLSAKSGHSRQGHATFLTGGIFHDPSMIEGLFSFGQYMRNIRINLPSGAGSQLDSLSGPGESFWMYRLVEPSGFVLRFCRALIEYRLIGLRTKKYWPLYMVIDQKPCTGGSSPLWKWITYLLDPSYALPSRILLRGRINCILGTIGAKTDCRDQRAHKVIGAVYAGLGRESQTLDLFDFFVDFELKHDPVESDLGDALDEVRVKFVWVKVLAWNQTNLCEPRDRSMRPPPQADWSSSIAQASEVRLCVHPVDLFTHGRFHVD